MVKRSDCNESDEAYAKRLSSARQRSARYRAEHPDYKHNYDLEHCDQINERQRERYALSQIEDGWMLELLTRPGIDTENEGGE